MFSTIIIISWFSLMFTSSKVERTLTSLHYHYWRKMTQWWKCGKRLKFKLRFLLSFKCKSACYEYRKVIIIYAAAAAKKKLKREVVNAGRDLLEEKSISRGWNQKVSWSASTIKTKVKFIVRSSSSSSKSENNGESSSNCWSRDKRETLVNSNVSYSHRDCIEASFISKILI